MVHLIVLHNGLWGTHKHLTYIQTTLQEKHSTLPSPLPIEFLNCTLNEGYATYHGVDGCGARLANAIIERFQSPDLPAVTHFSIIGYSLGGLIVRYTVGVLYVEGWLERVIPVTFCTFATPHLGATQEQGRVFDKVFNALAVVFTGRSGVHVFLKDGKARVGGAGRILGADGEREVEVEEELVKGRNILSVMSDPRLPFWKGLEKFKSRFAYANIKNDRLIAHKSGAFEIISPFDETLPEDRRYVVPDARFPSIVVPASAEVSSIPTPGERSSESSTGSTLANTTTTVNTDSKETKEEEVVPPKPWYSRIPFAVAAPVFIVVGVTSLTGYLLAYQTQHLVRMFIRAYPRKTITSSLNVYYNVNWWLSKWVTENVRERTVDVQDNEEFAAWGLNLLGWRKVHVLTEKARAHATIVKREPQFSGNEDVVVHFAEVFFEED